MKAAYDLTFFPAAPVLQISVRSHGARVSLVGKIDTAADVCGLPARIIDELSLPVTRRVRTSSFRGDPREATLHRADVVVAGRTFRQVELLPISRPYALLGRSLLNELAMLLDGPALTTEVRGRRRG